MRLYYAQNKEDLLIKGFFPDVKKGFYIDVGANDPVIDSVTKLFYDEGWSGINIEPIIKHYKQLQKQRPRDINLQVGLSDKSGTLNFRQYPKGDGLSTFNKDMIKLYEQDANLSYTSQYTDSRVPVKTLASVIKDAAPEHIHFIKIDVEGYESEVLSGYSWQNKRPELVCIEANHIVKDWRPILERNDYSFIFFDGVNNYYLAKESLHRKNFFNYPNAVFAGNPIYYPAFVEARKNIAQTDETRISELIGSQQSLMKKCTDLEIEIAFLHRQQRDVRFLAKQLTKELQLRLDKKANSRADPQRMVYAKDKTLNARLKAMPNNESDKLAFIHGRDKKNIRKHRLFIKNPFKSLFWKISARLFNTTTRVSYDVYLRRHHD